MTQSDWAMQAEIGISWTFCIYIVISIVFLLICVYNGTKYHTDFCHLEIWMLFIYEFCKTCVCVYDDGIWGMLWLPWYILLANLRALAFYCTQALFFERFGLYNVCLEMYWGSLAKTQT